MSVFSAILNNGPLQVGPLADRGAFDQYATYRPGNIVVDGGVVYLNVAPVSASVELEDTFDRADQSGWGVSSHGEFWQTSDGWSGGVPPIILGGQGVLRQPAEGTMDGQLLGPSRVRADMDLLLRLAFGPLPTGEHHQFSAVLNTDEAGTLWAMCTVVVRANGTSQLQVKTNDGADAHEDGATDDGPAFTTDSAWWFRLRRVGRVYTATLWAAGTPEPSTASTTLTATHDQPAGHVAFSWLSSQAGQDSALQHLVSYPLTASDPPADDTEHWVALADALQVPQPY